MQPDGLDIGKAERGREIWSALEQIVNICQWKSVDLLLIAGDLFHRQPLLRELKELNFLFSKMTRTKVVWIAGNHDYVKPDSHYRTFSWGENVYPLLTREIGHVEFPELETCVYGLSYDQREILDPLYDTAVAQGRQKYEILLAHGGDEKHIPFRKEQLLKLGYDYVALGHIHKPQVLIENRVIYAGALEPIDKNDTGKHGYVEGEIGPKGTKATFVPSARREYMHLPLVVDETMTNGEVKEKMKQCIRENGIENAYKFLLKGLRDADIRFEIEKEKCFGNVIEIVDETMPYYDFETLLEKNRGNLLGRYIESFRDVEPGSVEYRALHEGVQALIMTKGK